MENYEEKDVLSEHPLFDINYEEVKKELEEDWTNEPQPVQVFSGESGELVYVTNERYTNKDEAFKKSKKETKKQFPRFNLDTLYFIFRNFKLNTNGIITTR